jgi:regulator of sigma E protease
MREGKETSLRLPANFKTQFIAAKTPFADFRQSLVDSVIPGSLAEEAGLKTGDKIISVNNQKTGAFSVLSSMLSKYSDTDIQLMVLRNGEEIELTSHVSKEGKLGFTHPYFPSVYVSDSYNIIKSFPAGIELGIRKLAFYVLQMPIIFTKEGVQNLGGFGAIGNLFPPLWSWPDFWNMTAFLSIILGVMNLLPIPALDGGHVMFLIYEAVLRRKPNEKFMEYAQIAGMAFLLLLLLYANGNDILRFFQK